MAAVVWGTVAAIALLAAAPSPSPRTVASASTCSGPVKYYVVQPPTRGGQQEFLFEIAQKTLGNGNRYMEIFKLNVGRRQPDGQSLKDPTVLLPGWILRLPNDAQGPGVQCAQALPGQVATPSPPPATPPPATAATSSGAPPPLLLAGAALLALVLVGVLAVWVAPRVAPRSMEGLRGWRPRAPSPPRLRAPAWLRRRARPRRASPASLRSADPAARLALDRAFRTLGRTGAADEREPPRPYAALIDEDQITVHLAPARPGPPSPWETPDDGHTWRAPRRLLSEAPTNPEAPPSQPFLATVGAYNGARVLVDLGRVSGIVCVEGYVPGARKLVAFLAAELSAWPRSSSARLTLVGFDREGPASLAEVMEAWEARAASGSATRPSTAQVLFGRRPDRPGGGGSWELLVLAQQPSESDVDRLAAFTADPGQPRAVLLPGAVAGARWRWRLAGDGTLELDPLGITVDAPLTSETAGGNLD